MKSIKDIWSISKTIHQPHKPITERMAVFENGYHLCYPKRCLVRILLAHILYLVIFHLKQCTHTEGCA